MMGKSRKKIAVVGGGLAGSEVANVLSSAGYRVHIFEMKPKKNFPLPTDQIGLQNLCAQILLGPKK